MRGILATLVLIAAGCGDTSATPGGTNAPAADQPLTLAGPTMGTRYSVKLFGVPAGLTEDELKAGIESTLQQIDAAMSTWRDDSELSRFNQSQGADWFDVSPETALVVAEAVRIHAETGGAFDVTVNPLLKLWGFGPYDRPQRIPGQPQIDAVRRYVGSDKIDVRLDPPALRKDHPQVEIDLSGIAKGYAVDRVAEWLAGKGVQAYLVEIGGEVRTGGDRPDGRRWTVGIEKPTPNRRSVQKVVELSNLAMATSGDYRNYYEQEGVRYSHTFDPRTGRPVAHKLAAVSVVADSCMTADALATALMVLGPDEAYNLAVDQDWAVYLLVHDGKKIIERQSPRFSPLLSAKRGPEPQRDEK